MRTLIILLLLTGVAWADDLEFTTAANTTLAISYSDTSIEIYCKDGREFKFDDYRNLTEEEDTFVASAIFKAIRNLDPCGEDK